VAKFRKKPIVIEAARCVANDEADAETQQKIQRIEIGGNP